MKIHINQIPPEGLHVEGEESAAILELHDESVRILSPIRYSLDVGLSQGGLFATGNLSVDLEMECVACLEIFRLPLDVPEFAVQIDLGPTETVDLTESVREDILLALPPYPHCDWNGEKTCSGVRAIASGPVRETEAEPTGKNPWATLDQLNQPKDRTE